MKIVYAFLIISIVIIVHELGHFIIAKASGVKVVEFSVGMGPRLVKFKIKGTLYSIKLFLFGGSCKIFMNPRMLSLKLKRIIPRI